MFCENRPPFFDFWKKDIESCSWHDTVIHIICCSIVPPQHNFMPLVVATRDDKTIVRFLGRIHVGTGCQTNNENPFQYHKNPWTQTRKKHPTKTIQHKPNPEPPFLPSLNRGRTWKREPKWPQFQMLCEVHPFQHRRIRSAMLWIIYNYLYCIFLQPPWPLPFA